MAGFKCVESEDVDNKIWTLFCVLGYGLVEFALALEELGIVVVGGAQVDPVIHLGRLHCLQGTNIIMELQDITKYMSLLLPQEQSH